jgi:hypothetical protein
MNHTNRTYVVLGIIAALAVALAPTLASTAFASIDVNPNTQGQCIKLLNEAKGHGNDPFYQFLKNFVCKGFF